MSKFLISVKNVLYYLSNTRKKLKDVDEDLKIYMNSSSNFDSVWNDNNTEYFINIIKKDRSDFKEYIDSFNEYLNIIDNFYNSLSKIISKNLNITIVDKIEYNLDNINKAISYIDNSYQKIYQNCKIFETLNIPTTFKYYSIISNYQSQCIEYKNQIYNIRKNLIKTRDEIENLITNTKNKVNRFDVKEVSKTSIEHIYNNK